MSRRILSVVCLSLYGLMAPCAVWANSVQQSDPAAAASMPDEVVGIMAEKLALSDDQKTQITPIIADRQAQLRALREDTSLRRLQRAREAKRIFNESDKKINAILTPDQRKKYAAMEQEMRERAKEHAQQSSGVN